MPTKNPRLNVVLEPGLYATLKRLAEHDGLSLSLKARDMIREAVALYEDRHWAKEADTREKTLHVKKTLTHKEVWKS